MNLGTRSRAVRRKELDDVFARVFIDMFARLTKRGCATLSPVSAEIFVLSEDNIVPRRVAPLGSID
jgi:hypothetical protein